MGLSMSKRRMPLLVVALTACLSLGGAGLAMAAIPAADGTLNGCYARNGQLIGASKGDLRVVDEGERCRSHENAVSWSQRGPQGAPGPQGTPGRDGAQGPPGPTARTEVFFASMNGLITVENPGVVVVSKELPPGSYVVEGHVEVANLDPEGGEVVLCTLVDTSATAALDAEPRLGTRGARDRLSLTWAYHHPGGEIRLECRSPQPTIAGPATLLATKVDSVG